MKMRLLHIIGGVVLLCCILISARYIKYSYEINSYDVTLSFWALGPRSYYIAIAPAGESLRTYRKHFDFQQEVPYEVKELLFGVIPIRLFTRSVWPLPF